MKFKKGGIDIIDIDAAGDVTFSGYYQENSTANTKSGELKISESGVRKLDTNTDGTTNVRLEKRLFGKAVFPPKGLQIKAPANDIVIELDGAGNFYIKGNITNTLTNPATNGSFTVTSVVYAAPGLDYSNLDTVYQYLHVNYPTQFPTNNNQYAVFQNPDLNYTTKSIDISDFILGDLGYAELNSTPIFPNRWLFNKTNVPLNGLLRVPNGAGPFPLVLFAHGNHTPFENSTPGYIYLCGLLASHGIIAGTIDVNFLNGTIHGENAGRAIVMLEHVKQFKEWNNQGGHPLYHKVDTTRVILVGHSRGGEAVGHASYFNNLDEVIYAVGDPPVKIDGTGPNQLGPYHFGIKAVVGLAPTDNQYLPVDRGPPESNFQQEIKDNYLILHGTRDNDLNAFPGYRGYDRAQPIDLLNPIAPANGVKSLLWIYGANHNFFNSVWADETITSASPTGQTKINRSEQEGIAKVYLSDIAQALLLGRSQYLNLLKDYKIAHTNTWIPTKIKLVSAYQDKDRTFIQHFQDITVSSPVIGDVDTSNIKAKLIYLDQGDTSFLYEEAYGARLNWDNSSQAYLVNLENLDVNKYQFLALRVGQSPEVNNTVKNNQDFTIKISDDSTHFYAIKASLISPLPYPDKPAQTDVNNPVFERKTVMQTLRIPLINLKNAGVDLSNIKKIEFLFDQINHGTLYFADIQLTN